MRRFQFFWILFISGIFFLPLLSFSQSTGTLEKELENELSQINSKIISHRAEIALLRNKNRTLEEEIQFLDAKIDTLELQIEAGTLVAKDLQSQASQIEGEIALLVESINETKDTLADSLSELYLLEKRSLVEVVFSGNDFSDFFDKIQYVRNIQEGVGIGLNKLSLEKNELNEKQEALNQRLFSQERLLALQEVARQEVVSNKRAKAGVITQNTLQTVSLQEKTNALEDVARQIREQLYVLKGLTTSLELGEAYRRASLVASKVSIDPAFLMAILKVESDLGNNIGGGHWQKDMHPRDREAFAQITQKLGLNPDLMPVSSKPRYGWGGAMGPAQFLPTTWLSYEARVAQITGHNPPNPWELEDAFAAAAIKLAANGANRGDSAGEWEAAMKYFAGGRWQNPAYSFYGDRVMVVKDLIAAQIR